MKEKDYIYVYDDKGNKKRMELVLAINSDSGDFQYITYKEENKSVPLYIAKLYIKQGMSRLDTNLSIEEKQKVIKVIKEKVIGGNNEWKK